MRAIRFMFGAALVLTGAMVSAQVPSKNPGKTPGFDIGAMDKSVDACADFYQYACGSWIKNNPVPADQSRWSRFNELAERNNAVLREILEKASQGGEKRNPTDKMIGDYYGACMDEASVNKKGIAPLKPDLDAINGMKSKSDLTAVITRLHRSSTPGLFRFSSTQDAKDSATVIAEFDQGGLGLPNRDYYFKDDAKSKDLREKYVAHVSKVLQLEGDDRAKAAANANIILAMETELASGSLGPVDRRNPEKLYHPMTVAEFQKLAPSLNFTRYMQDLGTPKVTRLNVAVPDFAKAMESAISKHSLDDVKTYLRWHTLRSASPLLSADFVNENFDFFSRTLRGAKEIRPRWKRCVQYTDNNLGEALGIAYVEKAFGPEARKRMSELVHNLEVALKADIEGLDWMTPTTKQRAVEKLSTMVNKVGYPEKWRDYSSVKIAPGDLLGNSERASIFEVKRQLNKIGKPVDFKEWLMSPPTVNAYYLAEQNNINFPAGILQPPFFDAKIDDAVNYGAIGAVIGHELTHGFDDQGSQYDAQGNLKDWWTAEDKQAFKQRTSCVVNEYNGFPVDDLKVNGELTLGENTADNGGVRIAYMALLEALKGKSVAPIEGFTPEQRLFLGWGQIWCQNSTPQAARLQVQTDPHSPGKYRVNGVVSNMPEFQKAFGCKAGQPMVSANACRVW